MGMKSHRAKKRVAVFIAHYGIDNSPSILNILDFLSDRYQITLFVRRVGQRQSHIFKCITQVELDSDLLLLKRTFSSWCGAGDRFDGVLCFDPHGLLVCSVLFPRIRPIYYSLELYLKNDHFGLHYPWWTRLIERARIGSIRGLIIQSQEKDELFREDYGLSSQIPTFLLPVTYNGPSSSVKSDHFREKFSVTEGVRIALHLGGIAEWFSCIEMARTFAKIEGWALVFHGYASLAYLERLKDVLKDEAIDNVFINDEQYHALEMVDKVIRSCDLGIAWYNDVSAGFRTAGHSSGKIPAYLRFGLPVVAKRYRSTFEAIEEPGAGKCVEGMQEIPAVVAEIVREYSLYSARACVTYDRCYNFRNYVCGLELFMESCWGVQSR